MTGRAPFYGGVLLVVVGLFGLVFGLAWLLPLFIPWGFVGAVIFGVLLSLGFWAGPDLALIWGHWLARLGSSTPGKGGVTHG